MDFIIVIGWLTIAYFLYKLGKALYNVIYPYLLAPSVDLKKLAGANWAVITGSTDGIGKQYAFQLAGRGFSIVLISRSQSKLDQTKQEILQKHPKVYVKTIVFDFTNANLEDYETVILKGLEGLDIGVLVNNVGRSYDLPDRFDKINTKYHRDLSVVNIVSVVVLTSAIVNQMVARNKGIIINISSSASMFPMKYYSVYSASKIFVTWLTRILQKEYSNTDIIFQVINPGRVTTNMTHMADSEATFFEPTAKKFVTQALNTVGHIGETTGCLQHEIEMTPARIMPTFVLDHVAETMRANKHKRFGAKKDQ